MEFPNTGWYLLSTSSEHSWNDAKAYWNLTNSTIYQYIYELSGVPIPNETQLTNNNWTPIDISNNNPSLKPYKGYWVNITSIGPEPRVFSGTGELTEATVSAQLDGATIVIIEGYTSIGNSAFSNASSLTSITIPSSVTSIGESAFQGATSLTSITIPAGVTSIGLSAFSSSGLTEATINVDMLGQTNFPAALGSGETIGGKTGVNIIGYKVFTGTGTLSDATADLSGATVAIIEGYTSIGLNAFLNAPNLTSVTFAEGSQLTSIGNSAFYNASSLTSITIPASVRTIESMAFQGCSNLTSITFAEGSGGPQLTSIGSGVFIYSKLTSIIIPASVTSIGAGIFYQVDSLTSITFDPSSNLTSIGEQAFQSTGLTSIIIPTSVTSIESSAFTGSGLTEATINVDMLGQTNFPAALGSGQTIGGKTGVNIIGYKVFTGTGELTEATVSAAQLDGATIVIIEGYTSIGNSAFNSATSLTSITIPASVTSIGDGAFFGAFSLTSITVNLENTNYKDISGVLFNSDGTTLIQYPPGNTRITYDIPASVTSIENYAFQDASSLTSITIPASVTSIGILAFFGTGITNVLYNENNTMLVYYPPSLINTTFTIPASVTSIGSSAFSYAQNLTSVTFAEGSQLTSIGNSAFYGVSGLTSITIPASVTSIGLYAFVGVTSLASITVNTNYKDISGVLFNSNGTTLIQYPIGNTITTYDIPTSVTSIGENAFQDATSLTSITIPASVTSIGDAAFYGASSLTSVTLYSTTITSLNSVNPSPNIPTTTSTMSSFYNSTAGTVTITVL